MSFQRHAAAYVAASILVTPINGASVVLARRPAAKEAAPLTPQP
jgi:hypothetical protein